MSDYDCFECHFNSFELKSFKVHGWRPAISHDFPPAEPVCVWTPRTSHQHISEPPQSLRTSTLGALGRWMSLVALHNSIGHSSHGISATNWSQFGSSNFTSKTKQKVGFFLGQHLGNICSIVLQWQGAIGPRPSVDEM